MLQRCICFKTVLPSVSSMATAAFWRACGKCLQPARGSQGSGFCTNHSSQPNILYFCWVIRVMDLLALWRSHSYLLIKGQSWYSFNICPSSFLCTSMRFRLSMGFYWTIELFFFNMMEQLWCCNMLTIGPWCSQLSVMGGWSKGSSPQQLAFVVWVLLLSLCCFSSLLLHVTMVLISCAFLQGITRGRETLVSSHGGVYGLGRLAPLVVAFCPFF